jgi:dTMP kinase
MARRGALIVFEGCDRVGKSTQCRRLVEALEKSGINAKMMSFPNRKTTIGTQINAYLNSEINLEDHSVHLLFAANRWEMV